MKSRNNKGDRVVATPPGTGAKKESGFAKILEIAVLAATVILAVDRLARSRFGRRLLRRLFPKLFSKNDEIIDV